MPIAFTCPHCGLQTNVADEYVGQTGPCSRCGKTITVPPLAGSPATPPRRAQGPLPAFVIVLGAVAAVFVCSGIPIALLLPAVQSAREAARRSECSGHLKQIALAMYNYHDAYGCFPPAYTADENGRRMHSWGVLLLPFLEQQPLYNRYSLDEPWDSPNNLSLADAMPDVYRCPSDPLSAGADTAYALIVGPNTISDGTGVTKLQDVTAGKANTILVVEAAGNRIHWLEPRDLEADQIRWQVNDPAGGGVRSFHPGGANVVFCDGRLGFLPNSTDPQSLRQMASITGSEGPDPATD